MRCRPILRAATPNARRTSTRGEGVLVHGLINGLTDGLLRDPQSSIAPNHVSGNSVFETCADQADHMTDETN